MAKIRVFTLNANGKIELTKEELQKLLDESYSDGSNSVTIATPSYPYNPFYYNTTATNITASDTNTTSQTIKVECVDGKNE